MQSLSLVTVAALRFFAGADALHGKWNRAWGSQGCRGQLRQRRSWGRDYESNLDVQSFEKLFEAAARNVGFSTAGLCVLDILSAGPFGKSVSNCVRGCDGLDCGHEGIQCPWR